MIDTIVLSIPSGHYEIVDPGRFSPSPEGLFIPPYYKLGGRGNFSCYQNPTSEQLKQGIYLPRLTITKRMKNGSFDIPLKIELSLPKLLFGNNFDELQENDFEAIANKLQTALKSMGIRIFYERLITAPVSAIHYSKNIPLTDGTTPHYLISKIKEANVNLALDVNQTDYRNDGSSYKWHANSYEVAFYDKIKDLETAKKSEKRAIENDSFMQLNLFEQLQEQKRLEVLRMEVRLNKRQKIQQLFHTLGIQSEPTFENLFNLAISQQVLLHYLDQIESKRLPLVDYQPTSPKSLLADFVINNSDLGLLKIMQLYGLKHALDNVAPRELRAMFSKYGSRSWYRLMAEAKAIKLPITNDPFGVIREYLAKFEPLRLVDFQDRMINNDK